MCLKFIPLLFILFNFSCKSVEQKEHKQFEALLASAPDAGPGYFDNSEAYSLALGSYKDSCEIKYYITEPAPMMTMEETQALVEDAITMWGTAIDKPFKPVNCIEQANIYFTFEFMDGKGGSFGYAEPPPYFPIKNWNRKIALDKYDINPHSKYDAVTIVGHEVGHGIGLRHSNDNVALMNEKYIGPKRMALDDHFGARVLYDQKKKFRYAGRSYLAIENIPDSIAPNFLTSEFFSRCTDFPDDFHFLDETLIEAVQRIRDYYNQPVQIISSYRHYECNMAAGGATFSEHKNANALDFKFVGRRARNAYHAYSDDVINQTGVFPDLITIGIGGFGSYANSFHIDTRTGGHQHFAGIDYALWGKFMEDGYSIDFEHPYGIE